jgi:hypothetical protein
MYVDFIEFQILLACLQKPTSQTAVHNTKWNTNTPTKYTPDPQHARTKNNFGIDILKTNFKYFVIM